MWYLMVLFFFFLNNFIYLFGFGCIELSLPFRLFSSCGEWELLSSCSAQASHCGGLSCCRAWAIGQVSLVAAAPRP